MKILIISFYFPPFNAIPAVRLGKMAKYFLKYGHDVRVVSAAKQPLPTNLSLEIPREKLIYTYWFDLRRLAQSLFKERQEVEDLNPLPEKRLMFLKKSKTWRFLRSQVLFPDEQIGWFPFALAAVSRLMKTWKPDIIYASSSPITSLLIAKSVSQKYGVPFVGELRDLWVDGYYFPHPGWRNLIEKKVEREIFLSAAGIVTVSEPLAQILYGKYGKTTEVILNGFDPEDYLEKAEIPFNDGKITIVHTGTIYEGKRDPSPLFEALRGLGTLNKKVQVLFYGDNVRSMERLAKFYDVAHIVKEKHRVSHKEALAIQKTSDILLLLLWNDKREEGVYTGKLFEYLGACRPILALTHPSNIAGQLVRKLNAGFTSNDPDKIASKLRQWIDQKGKDGKIPSLSGDGIENFSRESQAKICLNFMSGVLNG